MAGAGPQFVYYEYSRYRRTITSDDSCWGIKGFGEVLMGSVGIKSPNLWNILALNASVNGLLHYANFDPIIYNRGSATFIESNVNFLTGAVQITLGISIKLSKY
jgi:hypothetical protein